MLIGIVIFLILAVLLLTGLTYNLARSSRSMQVTSGHDGDQLPPCPDSPNCVSSQAPVSNSHYIAPLGNADGNTWQVLLAALDTLEGAKLISLESDYAYYTFQTPLMGFVDDVEFLNAPGQGVIHVRSASRVGRSDMNANRNRVELIRSRLK